MFENSIYKGCVSDSVDALIFICVLPYDNETHISIVWSRNFELFCIHYCSIIPVRHLFAATTCLVHAKWSFLRFQNSVVLENSICDKFDIWYFCSALGETSVDTGPKLNHLPGMRETMIAQMIFLLTPVADHDQASTP